MKTLPFTTAVVFGTWLTVHAAAASYTISELQTPWDYAVGLGGLTRGGAVAGTAVKGTNDSDSLNDSIAFLWKNGNAHELGISPMLEGYFEVRGINRREEVVGGFTGTNNRALWWRGGTMRDLGNLGGSHAFAYGINDLGDVVGAATVPGDNNWHAFLYRSGVMIDLGVFGGRDTFAFAINNRRQIVIEYQDSSANQLAIYHRGHFRIIGSIGGWTSGEAINEAGHVVGVCQGEVEPGQHAFFYDGHRLVDLHVTGETFSESKSINNWDEIVGTWGIDAGYDSQGGGFLYRKGQREEISALLPPGSGWIILTADYINDAGQIVGVGLHNGVRKFYLLTPANTHR